MSSPRRTCDHSLPFFSTNTFSPVESTSTDRLSCEALCFMLSPASAFTFASATGALTQSQV